MEALCLDKGGKNAQLFDSYRFSVTKFVKPIPCRTTICSFTTR